MTADHLIAVFAHGNNTLTFHSIICNDPDLLNTYPAGNKERNKPRDARVNQQFQVAL